MSFQWEGDDKSRTSFILYRRPIVWGTGIASCEVQREPNELEAMKEVAWKPKGKRQLISLHTCRPELTGGGGDGGGGGGGLPHIVEQRGW